MKLASSDFEPAAVDALGNVEIRPNEFRALRELIHKETGIFLNDNKQEMLCARLSKRIRHFRYASYSQYLDHLKNSDRDGAELSQMINCVTTNKTDFFREEHHFEFLRKRALPELVARASRGGPRKLRIWCAASSTGEEPYTLAMTVREHFYGQLGWDLKIIASDIDTDVLSKAKAGVYAADRTSTIPPALLHKYFLKGTGAQAGQVQASRELKDLLSFERVNLMDEPWPIVGPFDMIFCRNVIIYFDRATQQRLMERFASMLAPNGYLFLGHSENLHWLTSLFSLEGPTTYSLAGQSRKPGKEGNQPESDKPNTAGSAMVSVPKRTDFIAPKIQLNTTVANPLTNQGSSSTSSPPRNRPSRDASPRSGFPSTHPRERSIQVASGTMVERSIIVGEVFASREPAKIQTILGSCVSACLFDPEVRIGGMNHFSLPNGMADGGNLAKFGIHAMELLINEIMKLGGDRRRLRAKIFGGGKVINSASASFNVGQKNIDFAKSYLSTEGIPIVGERLGGETGLKVVFMSHTAKALIKPLESSIAIKVAEQEKQQAIQHVEKVTAADDDSVVLF